MSTSSVMIAILPLIVKALMAEDRFRSPAVLVSINALTFRFIERFLNFFVSARVIMNNLEPSSLAAYDMSEQWGLLSAQVARTQNELLRIISAIGMVSSLLGN